MGVVTRLAAFISALTLSCSCFSKLVWSTMIGKETFISCGISHETVLFFSASWRTERPLMHLRTQGHTSQIFVSCEHDFWLASRCLTLVCLHRCAILATRERLPGTTVAHRSALSSSSLLSLNSKPDGPYVHDVHGFLR